VSAVHGDPKLLRPLGIAVAIAALVLFADLFIPFATQGCINCPTSLPGTTLILPSFSLTQGLDGWIVLLLVSALGLEGTAYLFSRRRFAAIASLVLAVIVLALGIFEGVDSAGRVVGLDAQAQPVELGGTGVIAHGTAPPAHLITGFYVFLTAAVVAVIAAAIVVALTLRGSRQRAVIYSPASSAT
jgi:hypothetical protein